MDLFELAQKKKMLIVGHRSFQCGRIPGNSMLAFQAALMAGVDAIELDIAKSADGEVFVLHPGMEWHTLAYHTSIENYPASVVEQLRLQMPTGGESNSRIPRLEEALTFLKGKSFIVIDKFTGAGKVDMTVFQNTIKLVRKLDMVDQVLVRILDTDEHISLMEEYAPDFPCLPVSKLGLEKHEEMMGRKFNYTALESTFQSDDDPGAAKELIDRLHADRKLAFSNGIDFNSGHLAGGHSDDIAVTLDPEYGWGWHADRGFDMIQTDFPYQCRRFMEDTGRRTV